MARWSRLAVVSLALALACGKRDAEPKPDPGATPATPGATDGAPPAAEAPVELGEDAGVIAAAAKVTDADRKAYVEHLERSRALAIEKKWGEAVVELEAALKRVPGDPRALLELGWAAFEAGDLDKAKDASSKAVLVATTPLMKATAYYQLGRVADAEGNHDEAARYYRLSLKIRPDPKVEIRLQVPHEALPDPAEVVTEDLPCVEHVERKAGKRAKVTYTAEALCTCLLDAKRLLVPDEDATCKTTEQQKLLVATVESRYERLLYLAAGTGDQDALENERTWQVVAFLGREYNPGKLGIDEELELVHVDSTPYKPYTVWQVRTRHLREDVDTLTWERQIHEQTNVTLCVEGIHGTSCAIQVPVDVRHERRRVKGFEPDESVADMATPGLPIETHIKLRIQVKDEGTVTVILTEGPKTFDIQRYLGSHRLWKR